MFMSMEEELRGTFHGMFYHEKLERSEFVEAVFLVNVVFLLCLQSLSKRSGWIEYTRTDLSPGDGPGG